MSEMSEVQAYAVECAKEALERSELYAEIAQHVQSGMDDRFGPEWFCLAGENHWPGLAWPCPFLAFTIGHVTFNLFKA